MSKLSFKYNKKTNSYYVSLSIKFPEVVQERVLEAINAGTFDNFIYVSLKNVRKKSLDLQCCVRNFFTLSDYFRLRVISLNEYLDFVAKIIKVIKQCDNNLLNSNNIELRTNAIFIDPNTKIIKCIYWPIVNNQKFVTQKNFFKNLPSFVNFSENDKNILAKNYKKFFDGIIPFSLNNFEKLILELQGKKVQTTDISPSSNLLNENGTSTSLRPSSAIAKNLTYDPVALSTSSKKLNDSYNVIAEQIKLKRSSNGEQISITSAVFKIGKSEADNNYAIVDNSAISRKHAEILLKNNVYYLIDCNSTNGVYINGKRIKPAVEYKIKKGDKIKLANEEFDII